jgi:hypothetical protein
MTALRTCVPYLTRVVTVEFARFRRQHPRNGEMDQLVRDIAVNRRSASFDLFFSFDLAF